MKETFLTVLNKPVLVAGISLVIAVAIGVGVFFMGNTTPARAFVAATPGSISTAGDPIPGSNLSHVSLSFLATGRVTEVSVQVGQEVKKGDVLAALDPENTLGALTQAQAAYAAANAAYQKVVNGATGPAIDVAKAAVNSATVARTEVEKQQDVAVESARIALLNATPTAHKENSTAGVETDAPAISGSYTLGKEGDIVIKTYSSHAGPGISFSLSGLVTGGGVGSTITPQPLGNSGLSIIFPSDARANETWIISLPNTNAPDYISKENAYQAALQARSTAIATADAAVTQATANLATVVASARPEDVATAQAQVQNAEGALQIAESAYNLRRIIAPGDGTVTAVHVSVGQTASPSTPAIELSGTSFAKEVAVMVPNAAILSKNGKIYVLVKNGAKTKEQEVTIGIKDSQNTEVVSGLSVGDQVVVTK